MPVYLLRHENWEQFLPAFNDFAKNFNDRATKDLNKSYICKNYLLYGNLLIRWNISKLSRNLLTKIWSNMKISISNQGTNLKNIVWENSETMLRSKPDSFLIRIVYFLITEKNFNHELLSISNYFLNFWGSIAVCAT